MNPLLSTIDKIQKRWSQAQLHMPLISQQVFLHVSCPSSKSQHHQILQKLSTVEQVRNAKGSLQMDICMLEKENVRRDLPWETWMADTKGPYVPWYGMQQVPFPAQKKWMSMIVLVTFASNVLINAFLDPPASFLMLKSLRTISP